MKQVAGFVWKQKPKPPSFVNGWVGTRGLYSLRTFSEGLSYRLPTLYAGMIGEDEMKKFRIQEGDYVVRKSAGIQMPISTINGFPAEEWKNRWCKIPIPAWSDLPNKPSEFLHLGSDYDPLAKLTTVLLPQREGTMVFLAGPAASRKSDLVKAYLWSLDPDRYRIMYIFLERSDEIPVTTGTTVQTKKELLPSWAELWTFPFEKQLEEAELVDYVNFAIETAKRRVLAGENVILLVDSLEVFAKAINTSIVDDGGTLSGGLKRKGLTTLRTWMSSAKKPVLEGAGSLTILGLYRTNTRDTGTTSLATEIIGVIQGHIYMRGEDSIPCSVMPVDIKISKARMTETILGEEGAAKYRAFLGAVLGKENQTYLNAALNEKTFTSEQKLAILKRAGVQLEIVYRKLMGQCAQPTLLEIYDHWVGILDGTYPPVKPEFGPVELTPPQAVILDPAKVIPPIKPIDQIPIQATASSHDIALALGIAGDDPDKKQRKKELALPK